MRRSSLVTSSRYFQAAWFLLWGHAVFLSSAPAEPNYPKAKRGDFLETLHGIEIADPYRWLEEIDSEASRKWVTEQSAYAKAWFGSLKGREKTIKRLTELWSYDKFGIPRRKADKVFFTKQKSLQNQPVLYLKGDNKAEPEVLVDPNALSKDGTISLSSWSVNDQGTLVAYAISKAGSDWQEWRVRDIETGKDLPDRIEWAKFSGASWSPDGKGFCYSRYDAPLAGEEFKSANHYHKIYYHRVGEPQSKDRLLYERKDEKEWNFGGEFSEDGRYLVVSVFGGDFGVNALFYKDLKSGHSPVIELFDKFDAAYSYLGNDGRVFYLKTTKDAAKGRVVAVDLHKPEPHQWREIVRESKHKLQSASLVGSTLIVRYLEDVKSRVSIYNLEGTKLRDVSMEQIVSARGFGGSRKDTSTFYSVTAFTQPTTIYEYDIATDKSTAFAVPDLDIPKNIETKQIFFESKDGTRIPMFLVHKSGLRRNGRNPTLLYGYGGFNISLAPRFSPSNIYWLEKGGVYAVPNLRGGGEYGENWHLAGNLYNKQNVFDDFIAAAEWLIENDYTNPSKLAISGRSNGGLLVAACLTQRPDLFGAVDAGVGVLDMLRFDKFTIGWAWKGEYGDPAKANPFKNLLAYSPLHNLKKGTRYPPTLITTADHDDRVFPAHSFKFGAALQWAQNGKAPVLVRIDIDAGHGAGKPTSMIIEETADRWAFIEKALGGK